MNETKLMKDAITCYVFICLPRSCKIPLSKYILYFDSICFDGGGGGEGLYVGRVFYKNEANT